MSYYLEQLEKKGLKLKYEQAQTRKALKNEKVLLRDNKLNARMNAAVRMKVGV